MNAFCERERRSIQCESLRCILMKCKITSLYKRDKQESSLHAVAVSAKIKSYISSMLWDPFQL